MGAKMTKFKRVLGAYFNILPDKEDELETIANINHGIRFRGTNLWILVLGILLASLGLNIDSTAVVIGAMLVSPIMGPILGMGLAFGIKDYAMLRRSLKNYLVATVISVVTATIYFLLTPYQGAQSELFARTSPTLYDMTIAFFGGMAGILAVCTKGKGNVLPGVAIATALMPPLCTAGYGLATAQWNYFLGAFYLFFINTIFIGWATYAGVKLLRYRVRRAKASEIYHNLGKYIAVGIIVSMVPAAVMTYRIIRDSILENRVEKYIHAELEQMGVQVYSHKVDEDNHMLEVVAFGTNLDDKQIAKAKEKMCHYALDNYLLKVVQGVSGDSMLHLRDHMADARKGYNQTLELLERQSLEMANLHRKLHTYTCFDDLCGQLKQEISALFPEIDRFSMTLVKATPVDSFSEVSRQIVVVLEIRKDSVSGHFDKKNLQKWLELRLSENSEILDLTSPIVIKVFDN